MKLLTHYVCVKVFVLYLTFHLYYDVCKMYYLYMKTPKY